MVYRGSINARHYSDAGGPEEPEPSKRKTQRKGLSGNPQHRAEQLRTEPPEPSALQTELARLSGADTESLRDFAYRLAGGAKQAPWWRESHELILEKARGLNWPSRLLDIEAQTCELVGGQVYDDLQAHDGGHHQTRWLQGLVECVGPALRKAVTDGGDWQPLRTLLYGIGLTTPEPIVEDEEEAALREEFTDVKDPYATAVTELEETTTLLSHPERSELTSPKLPVSGALSAGVPLVARDAYGSRFLVAAPFGYEAGVPDHWYA